MKSLPPRAPGLACALLLAATTAAADEAPGTGRIRVEPVSCDSLLLRIDPDSFFALQEDRGEGFRTVQVLEDSGAEIVLRRSAPPPGGTVWFRLHGREPENGLPVYGSERIWTRRPPELNPRLEDDVMHWDPPACPLDRLWVSLYRDVRLSEVLTFPAAEGRAQLPPGDWNRIAVSWAGSAREVRLGDWEDPLPADQLGEMPGVPAGVAGLALPEAPDLPPPPRVLSVHSSGIELELPSGCVPLLLRGEAELRPLGGEQPRYMVAFGPPGELLVASRDQQGSRSLPILWEVRDRSLEPRMDRPAPGELELVFPEGRIPAETEILWLGRRGSTGGGSLSRNAVLLRDLPLKPLWIQLLARDAGARKAVWTGRVDLRWRPPLELVFSSSGDTLIRAELPDPGGWTETWEIDCRRAERATRGVFAAFHLLRPLPDTRRFECRWRSRNGDRLSEWSPWKVVGLEPGPPGDLRIDLAGKGVRLSWATEDSWLRDRVEVLRVAGGDSLLLRADWSAGALVDRRPPSQVLLEYFARGACTWRSSGWTPALRAAVSGLNDSWIALENLSVSQREVSVAEYRMYCRDSGRDFPPRLPVEGLEDYFERPELPMVNLSPREAMAYCDWLNRREGRSAAYDLDLGVETKARDCYRLLREEEFADLEKALGARAGDNPPAGTVTASRILPQAALVVMDEKSGNGPRAQRPTGGVREWVIGPAGPLAAGASWLRGSGGSAPYPLEYRAADVGFRLALETIQ